MIGLILWVIVIIIVAVAVCAVVKAALATPGMTWLAPYNQLIYALVVLAIVLICVSLLYNGTLPVNSFPRRTL